MSKAAFNLIDTHAHPQFPQYDTDREEVVKRAGEAKIGIICVGTDLTSSRAAIELANNYDGVWASVGLHPTDISDVNYELEIMNYESLLNHEKVVAVGEVGLDYYRIKNHELRIKQREIFEQFIELAIQYTKPLIIHCRNAHTDMLNILKSKISNHKSKLQGVIHSFTGTWDDAERYLKIGFFIGLNGIITFARDYDETVLSAPLPALLLETDAPFLTPVPHRGKRNEPAHVEFVARKIAEIRGISFDEVARVTTENARKLFNLNHELRIKIS